MIKTPYKALIAVIFSALIAVAPPATAQETGLSGTFEGIDAASGLTISLSEANGQAKGRIAAPDGSGEDLAGPANGNSFQSPLIYQAKPGIARISAKPLGISVVWSPVDADNNPVTGDEVVFVFRRKELVLPRPSARFKEPPAYVGRNPNPIDFLNSYEFWKPNDVARVYGAMSNRYRMLIEFHPAVRADIIWKLCQSETEGETLASILRGTGVTCEQMISTLRDAQKNNRFNDYKERVHTEREDALYAVRCAKGIHLPVVCNASADKTRDYAMSTETVATVMRSF